MGCVRNQIVTIINWSFWNRKNNRHLPGCSLLSTTQNSGLVKKLASSSFASLSQEKDTYLNGHISEDQLLRFGSQQDIKVSVPVTFLSALTKWLTGSSLRGGRFILSHSLRESSSPLWWGRHYTIHSYKSIWLDHLTSGLIKNRGILWLSSVSLFLLNRGHQPRDGKQHTQGGSSPPS